ncbi:hypothetical protein GCM10023336_62290 [Streptomyces similanensis]|uniref:Uncharacterized protein n=1 Tax=Streptomyces similanensis TaxID=1274988 RepID=A0ABP9LEE3_9ACTN
MASGILDEVSPCREADVERARVVREAIYQLVTARRLSEPYAAEALDTLNAAARKPSAVPRLTPAGRWTAPRHRRRRRPPWRDRPSNCRADPTGASPYRSVNRLALGTNQRPVLERLRRQRP